MKSILTLLLVLSSFSLIAQEGFEKEGKTSLQYEKKGVALPQQCQTITLGSNQIISLNEAGGMAPWEPDIFDYLSDRYNYWYNLSGQHHGIATIRTCDDFMKSSHIRLLLNDQVADGPFPGRICSELTNNRLTWAYPNTAGFNAVSQCAFTKDETSGIIVIRRANIYIQSVRCCKLPIN